MKRSPALNKYYMRAKRATYILETSPCAENVSTETHDTFVMNEVSSESEIEPSVLTSGLDDSENCSSLQCIENFIPEDYISSTLYEKENSSKINSLADWALKHNISHVAVNDLLKLLRSYPNNEPLPMDARTLLHTVRSVKVKSVNPGQYAHFGLRNCIQNILECLDYRAIKEMSSSIALHINIDGLPLCKSSSSQVYPILATDYMKARNKAKLAEVTSDLNTADEDDNLNKRKRIQKILSSSDSSGSFNESVLPSPPKVKKLKKKVEKTRHEGENDESPVFTSNIENEIQLHELDIFKEPSTSDANHMSTQCKNCDKQDKNFKTLLQHNHVLRSLVADTLSEIKDIKGILTHVTVAMNDESKINKDEFFKTPGINFPINTDNEFLHLENLLQSEQEFDKALRELYKLGGSSDYNHIKRLLSLMVSNNQALKYSRLGRKGKKPFNNLNISKLLIKSVELAGLSKSHKDTENAIQTWLRRASDRRGAILKKF